jgi:cyclophilin family peptidyl-prolyl cis-trans isomerase
MTLAILLATALAVPQAGGPSGADKPSTKPQVTLETSKGSIVIELDAEKAPKSVANFIEYVKAGYYDGTIFHRVIKGFMIQGGGFNAGMDKKATRAPIENEGKNGLKNDRGTIAMARTSDLNSATTQYIINLVNNDALNYPSNGGYAVFGKVVSGMEAVDAIAAAQTGVKAGMRDVPNETIAIVKATVKE